MEAQVHLREAGAEATIEEAAADKGYHAAEQFVLAESVVLRTYIPEPERKYLSRWTDKPLEQKYAVYANRRRIKTDKSKRLQRLRSERVERSFVHVCGTGGARRTWLFGIEKVRNRCLISALARNLGLVMRALFGMGTPRGLQQGGRAEDGLAALVQLTWIAGKSCQSAMASLGTLSILLSRSNTHHHALRHAA